MDTADVSHWPSTLDALGASADLLDVILLDELLAVTLNRACLLAELSQAVLETLAVGRPGALDILVTAHSEAAALHPPPWPATRYLPCSSPAAYDTRLDWYSRVLAARPRHWNWLEFAAAFGPMAPSCLGTGLSDVFEESKSRFGRPSFSARCSASFSTCLDAHFSLDEAADQRPRWGGGPVSALTSLHMPSALRVALPQRHRIYLVPVFGSHRTGASRVTWPSRRASESSSPLSAAPGAASAPASQLGGPTVGPTTPSRTLSSSPTS